MSSAWAVCARRRRASLLFPASLVLFFITTIAPGGLHPHLEAQQVTAKEPPRSGAVSSDSLPDLSTVPRAVPVKQRPEAGNLVDISSDDPQSYHGDLTVASGNVVITYRDHVFRADTVSYNKVTKEITATGHVELSGGDNSEDLHASRADYNLRTQSGHFYDVTGSAGDTSGPANAATTRAFLFAGKVVVKTGPASYDVYDGWMTSCQLPRPDWELTAHHIAMTPEAAHATGSVFRLIHVPILFLPYVTHPVDDRTRQSGLLIPVVSQSSTKGFVIGESAYFVLGRSADATVGLQYFSARGFSESGTFRYRGHGMDFFNAHFSALQDRGFRDNTFGFLVNQGGQDVTAAFRRDFTAKVRAVGDVEYLSSYIYREAFNDNFNQAVSSDILSVLYLTRQSNGYSLDGRFDRYQGLKRVQYTNKQGVVIPGEDIRIFHVPSIDFDSVEHHIGNTPLLWSLSASSAGLKRVQPPAPNLNTVFGVTNREDFRPEISLPLSGDGWHTMTSFAIRETVYSDSRKTPYGAAAVPIELHRAATRTSFELNVDVRPPAIERTFAVSKPLQKLFGAEVRHTVEPELHYRNVQGITDFLQYMRFDDNDLDSNTNELEYGVTQHLFFAPKPKAVVHPCAEHATSADDLTASPSASNEDESDPEAESVLATQGASTDANGIPVIDAQAADAPLRAHGRRNPACKPQPAATQREWFSWRLAQRHFFDTTFGGAVIRTRRNVFDTTLSLSGIAFITEARDISPLISRMRFRTSSHTDVEWDFDLDTGAAKFNSSNVFVDAHEGPWFGGLAYAGLNAPGRFFRETVVNDAQQLTSSAVSNFQQLRLLLGYGSPTRPGLSIAANTGLDLQAKSLQYGSLQASYNWNCCGLSVEYRKYELGPTRNEGVERFSFTLLNIGSAGNLRRSERLF